MAEQLTVSFDHVARAADIALRLGDVVAALRGARHLRSRCPEAVMPLTLLGLVALEAGRLGTASRLLNAAVERHPLDGRAWAGLAGAWSATGARVAAARALARAATLDLNEEPAGYERLLRDVQGDASFLAGLLACPEAPPAPGLSPVDAAVRAGMSALHDGRVPHAITRFESALAQAPDDHDVRTLYAEALRRAGDTAGSQDQLRRLSPEAASRLPALLVSAALAGPTSRAALQEKLTALDPDGSYARAFFSPDGCPWPPPAPPSLPWSEGLAPLAEHLDLAMHTLPVQSKAMRPASVDPAVAGAVATLNRLRLNLGSRRSTPPPLQPWPATERGFQAIVTNRSALLRRFGHGAVSEIERRLHELARAFKERGVTTLSLAGEEGLHLPDGTVIAPQGPDAQGLQATLAHASSALGEKGAALQTVLIIGGDEVVPFHRLTNPVPDDEPTILSDNPYGCDDDAYLLPNRVVARLPDGPPGDPTFLLTLLERQIAYHRGWSIPGRGAGCLTFGLGGPAAGFSGDSFALAAEVWQPASLEVLSAVRCPIELRTSPPLVAEQIRHEWLAGRQLAYFNLHGAQGAANWYGQPEQLPPAAASRLPVALRPEQLGGGAVNGAILVSEACYGAEISGGRSSRDAMLLRALAEGALGCVGSTVNAYASPAPPLLAADLLAYHLLRLLALGIPLGMALRQARIELAHQVMRRQGMLDDVDTKTLTSFVLYGDPWASLAARPPAQPKIAVTRLASLERRARLPDRRRLDPAQVPVELLAGVRRMAGMLLPGAAELKLSVAEELRAAPHTKGGMSLAYVFNAVDLAWTGDGYALNRRAQIVYRGNSLVKAVVSR